MRISQILSISLLTTMIACGDDETSTRPNDGTVTAWESCKWDGQIVPELCAPELSCSYHGVCSPICGNIDDCPQFEGFNIECGPGDYEDDICKPMCNTDEECPKTGGVDLICHQFYCIGDE